MFSLVPWVIVPLLAALCLNLISVRFMTGWEQNFFIWSTVSVGIATAIGMFGGTALFQNPQNVEIAIALLTVDLVAGFLIVYPCINEKEAKNIAQKFAREKHSPLLYTMTNAKLNNWTGMLLEARCLSVG